MSKNKKNRKMGIGLFLSAIVIINLARVASIFIVSYLLNC